MRTGAPPAASPATRPFGSARAPPPSVEQLHGSAILPHPYAPSTARAGYPYPSLPGHLYVSARIGPSGLPGACYRRARFSRLQSGSRQKERPLRRRGRVVRSTVVRREPQVGIEPTTARLRIEPRTVVTSRLMSVRSITRPREEARSGSAPGPAATSGAAGRDDHDVEARYSAGFAEISVSVLG